ncbi:MAG: hypothetical protein A2927_01555 [Candidatus Komeilibacteria bacterium RIFCSPLOWO2_01_FULL_45_10]|uniref:Uncharacterized protein n=1 Tax=Candidatus Komeilibacteria bacterium RIFCSPLOWO2_01_FULL_45_10 TaxID=1798550 RepID=A0A1G2BI74_9BACT|nr:MAG: hypothetical protein A2927_01555 [Candidatus Komeilibacteria bacterium RIFCSPLOWO2_01_FULL_45_10]
MTKAIKNRRELSPLLTVILSLVIIATASQLLVLARNSFEENQIVSAEELTVLPLEINQNQVRYLIEDGYLSLP